MTPPWGRIGPGEPGGKAAGLAAAPAVPDLPGLAIGVPPWAVLATGVFDAFVARNGLAEVALSGLPDERIGRAFLQGSLPPEVAGELRAVVQRCRGPLAVRSSGALEDASDHPFAGVYVTKMIPNDALDADTRFRKLAEAVKLVWASAFFRGAMLYRTRAGLAPDAEKMAVVIQEVAGRRRGERFYPTVSGVARSLNDYPSGHARSEDGVAQLALGLGKTIVDGGAAWSWCPAYPRNPIPFNSPWDLMKSTQNEFWAVRVGGTPPYDPLRETEYLVKAGLPEAEDDGALRFVASTFDPDSGRLRPGLGVSGPRVLDFAPVLVHGRVPINDAIRALLAACEDARGGPVEIEFAADLDPERGVPATFSFLQVRDLGRKGEDVEVGEEDLRRPEALIGSAAVLGHGRVEGVRDVLVLKREGFDPRSTPAIASELEGLDRALAAEGRPYVLVGFGRWGTSDPTAGVPVVWAQIGGARAIVEAAIPGMTPEPSQGSHFFHNLASFGVLYYTVRGPADRIDWESLERGEAVAETAHVRRVAFPQGLELRADRRSGRGVILRA